MAMMVLVYWAIMTFYTNFSQIPSTSENIIIAHIKSLQTITVKRWLQRHIFQLKALFTACQDCPIPTIQNEKFIPLPLFGLNGNPSRSWSDWFKRLMMVTQGEIVPHLGLTDCLPLSFSVFFKYFAATKLAGTFLKYKAFTVIKASLI